MAKTNRPVRLLVSDDLYQRPEIQALIERGHMVHTPEHDFLGIEDWSGGLFNYDVILMPNAWRMFDSLLPYMDTVLKAARERRYGKGKGATNAK